MWIRLAAWLLGALALVDLGLLTRATLRRRGAHVGWVLVLAPLGAAALGIGWWLRPPPTAPGPPASWLAYLLPMALPVVAFLLGFAYLVSTFLGEASGTRRLFAVHTAWAIAIGVAGILGLVALERAAG